MDTRITPIAASTPGTPNVINRPQKAETAKEQETVQLQDKIDLTGKEAAQVENKPEIMNRSAYSELEDIKFQLNDCKNSVKFAETRMYASNNDIQDASRNLRSSEFSIRRVEMDNDKTNVSQEGYSIDRYLSSAERDLNSSKREDDTAARNIDDVQRKLTGIKAKLQSIEASLSKPEENNASLLVRKAGDLVGQSQKKADDSDRVINSAGREIDGSLGHLTWADHHIWNIKSDRPGKDVSYEGRQLSYIVDRSQWDITDAEREIRDSHYDLSRLGQLLDSASRTVQDAQNELVKTKSE